jgi:uncharacterized protein (UPF0276 family)
VGPLWNDLPVLGVGASLSLEAKPDPALLVREPGGPRFIEYAGRLDVDEVLADVTRVRDAGVPVLFHPSYINFCGSGQNDAAWLAETARHVRTVGSPWFAQDCAYCFVGDDQGYATELGYFVPPVLSRDSLELAITRVREVQAAVPCLVAVEPPPMCFAVGRMGLLPFFGELAQRTDAALLFDVGHLASYQRATGKRIADELDGVPLERVVEVHIAGGRIDQGIYIDAHDRDVLPESFELLSLLLPKLTNLRALCFECEGKSEREVLDMLARLRELVRTHSGHARLVESA